MKKSQRKGFTILEFAALSVVIGLLAKAGLAYYQSYRLQAQTAKEQLDIQTIRQSLSLVSISKARLSVGTRLPTVVDVVNDLKLTTATGGSNPPQTVVPAVPPGWTSNTPPPYSSRSFDPRKLPTYFSSAYLSNNHGDPRDRAFLNGYSDQTGSVTHGGYNDSSDYYNYINNAAVGTGSMFLDIYIDTKVIVNNNFYEATPAQLNKFCEYVGAESAFNVVDSNTLICKKSNGDNATYFSFDHQIAAYGYCPSGYEFDGGVLYPGQIGIMPVNVMSCKLKDASKYTPSAYDYRCPDGYHDNAFKLNEYGPSSISDWLGFTPPQGSAQCTLVDTSKVICPEGYTKENGGCYPSQGSVTSGTTLASADGYMMKEAKDHSGVCVAPGRKVVFLQDAKNQIATTQSSDVVMAIGGNAVDDPVNCP